MAQRRKKKQPKQNRPVYRSNTSSIAAKNKAEAVIRKILQAYGFDPGLLDRFSKRQRWMILQLRAESLRFRVAEGHRVPRRVVDFVSETTHRFLRTHYFGDASIGLSYLDLTTYGMAFASIIYAINNNDSFPPEQMKIIHELAEFFGEDRVRQDLYPVGLFIHQIVVMISKVSFRIYGFDWKLYGSGISIKSDIYLSSEESVSIRFFHRQKEQKAFLVRAGQLISVPARNATIERGAIFPDEEGSTDLLDIYIQSHALYRAKERLDILPAHLRNFHLMGPLVSEQHVSYDSFGRPMLECYFKEEDSDVIVRFGYFPLIIQGNKLIVLTFLPLVAIQSDYLKEELGLVKEDMKFLGMDKLSFFLTVDFEQIPILKNVLKNTEIWDLMEYLLTLPDINVSIDQKRTQMVKSFFERKADLAISEATVPE